MAHIEVDVSSWGVISARLARPWPREAVIADLEWWDLIVGAGRAGRRPIQQDLMVRWGWPRQRVSRILAWWDLP